MRPLCTPSAQSRFNFLGDNLRNEPEDLLRFVTQGKVERLSHLSFFQDDHSPFDVIFCHRCLIPLRFRSLSDHDAPQRLGRGTDFVRRVEKAGAETQCAATIQRAGCAMGLGRAVQPGSRHNREYLIQHRSQLVGHVPIYHHGDDRRAAVQVGRSQHGGDEGLRSGAGWALLAMTEAALGSVRVINRDRIFRTGNALPSLDSNRWPGRVRRKARRSGRWRCCGACLRSSRWWRRWRACLRSGRWWRARRAWYSGLRYWR